MDHHTGERMADMVLEILGQYNLFQKLYCITADNASNNTTLGENLEDKLSGLGIHWPHEVIPVSCLDSH